jgi:hypothetical protein
VEIILYSLLDLPLHLFEKKASEYSKEQREFAITLHLHGPKAYRYLRSTLQLPLPHPRSLVSYVFFENEIKPTSISSKQQFYMVRAREVKMNCQVVKMYNHNELLEEN